MYTAATIRWNSMEYRAKWSAKMTPNKSKKNGINLKKSQQLQFLMEYPGKKNDFYIYFKFNSGC